MEGKDIILDGPVAVGKTTLMREFSRRLGEKLFVFPEFIDEHKFLSTDEEVERSKKILDKRFSGEEKPIVLQMYILERWKQFAERAKGIADGKIRIYERLPDDSVFVFGKNCVEPDEYVTLQEKLKEVDELLPSYLTMDGLDVLWIDFRNDFDPKKVEEVVDKAISSDKKYVFINITSDDNFSNYKSRGRKEELYTRESISQLNDSYADFIVEIYGKIRPVEYVRL